VTRRQLWRGGSFGPGDRCWLGLVLGQRRRRRLETWVHWIKTKPQLLTRFAGHGWIWIDRRLNYRRRRRVNILGGDVTLHAIRELNLAISKGRTNERHQSALREFLVGTTGLLRAVSVKLRCPCAHDIVFPAVGPRGWGCRFLGRTARLAQSEQDKRTTQKRARHLHGQRFAKLILFPTPAEGRKIRTSAAGGLCLQLWNTILQSSRAAVGAGAGRKRAVPTQRNGNGVGESMNMSRLQRWGGRNSARGVSAVCHSTYKNR